MEISIFFFVACNIFLLTRSIYSGVLPCYCRRTGGNEIIKHTMLSSTGGIVAHSGGHSGNVTVMTSPVQCCSMVGVGTQDTGYIYHIQPRPPSVSPHDPSRQYFILFLHQVIFATNLPKNPQ